MVSLVIKMSFLFNSPLKGSAFNNEIYINKYSIIHNLYLSMFFKLGILGFSLFFGLLFFDLKGIFNNKNNSNLFKIACIPVFIGAIFTPLQASEFIWFVIGFALLSEITDKNSEILPTKNKELQGEIYHDN